jgi:tetratricopeptide (TPR) repeat protein
VTDFGLAKLIAAAATGSATTLTGTGLLLGTPPYMAPERLALGPGRDEPGVDVYALGIILFCLLADRLPFEAGDPLDSCAKAAREDAPPLRQVDPSVPRDLETITSRALARDPRDRFVDAGELAEQLRRYLAREPLTIRPLSPPERLARWASRYRQALLASAASTGVVLVAAIVVLVAWNRNLHREQDALRDTMRSLWRSSARLFEASPPNDPAIRPFYDELARSFDDVLDRGQLGVEPSLARQVAVMHRQLATSLEVAGRLAEALSHLDRSIALLRPLPGRLDDESVRAWTEFDLFRSLSRRSVILRELSRLGDSLGDSDEALGLIRGLVSRFPADPAWSEALARHLLERKPLFERLGRPADAGHATVEAVDRAKQAAGLAPDDPIKLNTLLTALIRLAEVPALEAEKEQHLREALEVVGRLERLPGGGDWSTRDAQVLALTHLGQYYLNGGRPAEAAPFYEEMIEVLDKLIALSPESTRFRNDRQWASEALSRCRSSSGGSKAGPPR